MTEKVISKMPEDWQTAKDFSETNWMMWKFKVSCDVTFHVGAEREIIPAHKFILVSRSSVFFTMFHGPLAEKSEVTIPEIESDIFSTFLKYLYTNQVDVTVDNVMALLYAAKKYAVIALGKKCVSFLESILTIENACDILEQCHLYSEDTLAQKALRIIFLNGEEALVSSGFKDICKSCLDRLLSSDELRASEVNIFRAALWWSEAECERQGREVTPTMKFEVLKESLKYIRFQQIDSTILGNFIGILDTCWSHFLKPFMDSKVDNNNETRREMPVARVIRFEQFHESLSWTYSHRRTDAISFSCSIPVKIHGIILYNAFFDNSVKDMETYNIVCCMEECLRQDYTSPTFFKGGNVLEGSLLNKTVIVNPREEFIELYFAKPLQLSPNLNYTVVLLDVSGKDSKRGVYGLHIVEQGGVQWTFANSSKSKNGTDVEHGQIPGLIYQCDCSVQRTDPRFDLPV